MDKVSRERTPGVVPGAMAQFGAGGLLRRLFGITEFVIFLFAILLIIGGEILNPNFLALDNVKIMTRDTAILAIAAIGVGFTILTAGIDLSVGSIVALGGVMTAYFIINMNLPVWFSIVLTFVLAFFIGLIHGLFVTKLKMHGFLITLVTMGVARGFVLVITNAFPIPGLPLEFNYIGQGYLFDVIPIPVIICAFMALIAFYLLRFSYIGRQIYAAGGNIEAARLSGINVDARIMLCYIISVVCATTVGIIQAARMSMGHPGSGEGYELLAITACILGGTSFMGGEGGVPGILLGAVLIGVLQDAMIMVNVNPYWHKIVISLVLLLAVSIDYLRRRART
jgi:ribose transport system permease protein